MKAGGGLFAAIFSIVVMILFLPGLFDKVADARVDPATQQFSVTTGVGVTTANVTLNQPNFHENSVEGISVESDNSDDVPAPTDYVSSTRALTIGGLEAGYTRALTVDFEVEALDDSFDVGVSVVPYLLLFGVIALIIGFIIKQFISN